MRLPDNEAQGISIDAGNILAKLELEVTDQCICTCVLCVNSIALLELAEAPTRILSYSDAFSPILVLLPMSVVWCLRSMLECLLHCSSTY